MFQIPTEAGQLEAVKHFLHEAPERAVNKTVK